MKVFGKDGALASVLDSYEERPQQLQTAQLIHTGIKDNRPVVIEAPTGVGKSLGALIPALHRLKIEPHRKIIVVTSTINLQHQYERNDLPLLQKLGFNFTFMLLKGMSNYICNLKAHAYLKERSNEAARELERFMKETETGDVQSLSPGVYLILGSVDLTVSHEDCIKSKCPFYPQQCYYHKARTQAHTTDVVIVNYHYFLSHMRLLNAFYDEEEEGLSDYAYVLLPKVTNIIFDEAHVLKDIAREFMGERLKSVSILRVIDSLGRLNPDTAARLAMANANFFHFLDSYLGKTSMRLAFDINVGSLKPLAVEFIECLAVGEKQFQTEIHNVETAVGKDHSDTKTVLTLTRNASQCKNTLQLVRHVTNIVSDPADAREARLAIWASRGDRKYKDLPDVSLNVQPMYVAGYFNDLLPLITSQATYMSATLYPPAIMRDLGIDAQTAISERVDDVFDWASNSLLYVPNLGDPKDNDYDTLCAQLIRDMVRLFGGSGVLALFTSYKAIYKAEALVKKLRLKHPLLVQHPGESAAELAREFKKGDRVLLATRSFFQGVDFPGVINCLFINKIPFKHFDDPITNTMQYLGENDWFKVESLPHAINFFKQAVGRLLRKSTDKGVIVCPDTRLVTATFGKTIARSLPKGLKLTEDWDEFNAKCKQLGLIN